MMPHRLALVFAVAVASLAACSKDGNPAEAASGNKSDSADGLVIPSSAPYQPSAVEASTALVVTLVGDSTPRPKGSGDCAAVSDGETVFWLDGIREGKPLPLERRYQLVSGSCGLTPRIQGIVVGGAVNVFNDAGVHRLVFTRVGTNDTLQTMPFSLAGSVVPTDRLSKTVGVVEVKCSYHVAEKAYIAVFDHPYFGVASSGDKITLESVPPGDYRVMTWHEGLSAPTVLTTKVGTTGQTEIVIR